MCLGLPTAQTHCWCLQSAKQNKGETHRQREGERARERFCTRSESNMGGRSVCVFGRLQGLGSVCVCFVGSTVCHDMSPPPAKVD